MGVKPVSEKAYDRALRIKTIGLREWQDDAVAYHRYEATPYRSLEILFQNYELQENDQVVDFGCGRGRVAFYIHNHFHVPVTGIEANDLTYDEALSNKVKYQQRAKHIKAPIHFKHGLAEDYQVEAADNVFYFFNPFPATTFRRVVSNIRSSVKHVARPVDIILYYPMPKYIKFLEMGSPFKLVNEVIIPGVGDPTEKFLVYRHGIGSAE